MEISVVTPTIRKEGLKIVNKALRRQTFTDYEWIIGSPFKPEQDAVWVEDTYDDGFWSLNRIYNDLIRKADGDLIVSIQDYTFFDPDTLERFYTHFEQEPNVLVTGVGNKYNEVYPSTRGQTWQDPRERDDMGTYYQCFFDDIEWNFCSVPRQAVYDVGGFDEGLDFLGYGMDGYSVNDRINDLGGYDFKIDQSIKSYSLEHGRPEGWDENNLLNGGYKERREELKNEGIWPILDYLS